MTISKIQASGLPNPSIQNQSAGLKSSVFFGASDKNDESDIIDLASKVVNESDSIDEVDATDEVSDLGLKDQLWDEAEEFTTNLKKNELVQGVRQFVAVMSKALAFNGIFKEGNPDSSWSDRVYAVVQVAFAQMNDVITGNQASHRPDGSNIYYSVLSRFPGLVLDDTIQYPDGINVVDKAIASSTSLKSATVKNNVNNLKEKYADVNLKDDMTRAELARDLAKAFGVRVN